VKNDADVSRPGLDIRIRQQGNDCIVTHVYENGTAHFAGISAGDVLLALDGLRVSADGKSIPGQLSRYALGDTITIHVFRRDELMELTAILVSEETPNYSFSLMENAPDTVKKARKFWLGT